MGADISIIQSMDSLTNTIDSIQQKLENIQKRSEDFVDITNGTSLAITKDNFIIIANRRIKCNPLVKLVIGPILGLITYSSCRILIETNYSNDVTFYLFSIDNIKQQENHDIQIENLHIMTICELNKYCIANEPLVVEFQDLLPNTNYIIYIGGLQCDDVYQKYATFTTPSLDGNNTKVLCLHDSKIQCTSNTNDNVLNNLERYVTSHCHLSNSNNDDNVNVIIHNGGSLLYDNNPKQYAIELLNFHLSDNYDEKIWYDLNKNIDKMMKQHFINIFNQKSLQVILRRCCNLFLANELEAVPHIISLFLSKFTNLKEEEIQFQDNIGLQELYEEFQQHMMNEETQEETQNKAANPNLLDMINEGNDDKPKPSTIKNISIQETLESLHKKLNMKDQESKEENSRKVNDILSLILRKARRLCYQYYRHLWEDVSEWISRDQAIEALLHQQLLLMKQLHIRKDMFYHTLETKLRIQMSDYGTQEVKQYMNQQLKTIVVESLNQYENQYLAVCNQLYELQHPLGSLEDVNTLNDKTVIHLNQELTSISLGSLCLIVHESVWMKLLDSHGKYRHQLIPIIQDNNIISKLQQLVEYHDLQRIESIGIDSDATSSSKKVVVSKIMFISTEPLIEFPSHLISRQHVMLQVFQYLSQWQAKANKNSVLVASPSHWNHQSINQELCLGHLMPCSLFHFLRDGVSLEVDDVGYDETTYPLQMILLPSLRVDVNRSTHKSSLSSLLQLATNLEEGLMNTLPSTNQSSHNWSFVSSATLNTIQHQNKKEINSRHPFLGFWEATFQHPKSSILPSSLPSLVDLQLHRSLEDISDSKHVIFGPLILSLSPYSIEVIYKFNAEGLISTLIVDEFTGEELVISNIAKRDEVCIFTTSELKPNHLYEVCLLHSNDKIGSLQFMTPRLVNNEESKGEGHLIHPSNDVLMTPRLVNEESNLNNQEEEHLGIPFNNILIKDSNDCILNEHIDSQHQSIPIFLMSSLICHETCDISKVLETKTLFQSFQETIEWNHFSPCVILHLGYNTIDYSLVQDRMNLYLQSSNVLYQEDHHELEDLIRLAIDTSLGSKQLINANTNTCIHIILPNTLLDCQAILNETHQSLNSCNILRDKARLLFHCLQRVQRQYLLFNCIHSLNHLHKEMVFYHLEPTLTSNGGFILSNEQYEQFSQFFIKLTRQYTGTCLSDTGSDTLPIVVILSPIPILPLQSNTCIRKQNNYLIEFSLKESMHLIQLVYDLWINKGYPSSKLLILSSSSIGCKSNIQLVDKTNQSRHSLYQICCSNPSLPLQSISLSSLTSEYMGPMYSNNLFDVYCKHEYHNYCIPKITQSNTRDININMISHTSSNPMNSLNNNKRMLFIQQSIRVFQSNKEFNDQENIIIVKNIQLIKVISYLYQQQGIQDCLHLMFKDYIKTNYQFIQQFYIFLRHSFLIHMINNDLSMKPSLLIIQLVYQLCSIQLDDIIYQLSQSNNENKRFILFSQSNVKQENQINEMKNKSILMNLLSQNEYFFHCFVMNIILYQLLLENTSLGLE